MTIPLNMMARPAKRTGQQTAFDGMIVNGTPIKEIIEKAQG